MWKDASGGEGLQYTVLIVASGLIGIEIATIFLLTSMTISVTSDFGLSSVQQGLLMSFTAMGGLVGSLVIGHIADCKGRRPPVLCSLAFTAVFAFLAAHAKTYHALVMMGMALGFSLGIGLVPISVLLSETTPEGSRMFARGACQCLGGVCGFMMLVAVQFDDATFRHLHWRSLLRGLSFAAGCLFLLACSCLGESPRIVKMMDRQTRGFDSVWRNLSPASVLGARTCHRQGRHMMGSGKGDTTIRGQLNLVFSQRFYRTTIYIGAGAFIAGLVQGGHQYALPQILSKEMSLMNAATARMAISCFGVPMAPAAQYTATKLSRRAALSALGLSSMVVALSTALLGSWPSPQPPAVELIFYFAMSLDPYRAFLAGLLFGEIGADVFPASTAGFGASIVAVSIGVATIVAPMLFESLLLLTGTWATFYYIVSVLIALFLLATWFAAPCVEPCGHREGDTVEEESPEGCDQNHQDDCKYGSLAQLQL